MADGIALDAFRRNPTVLWEHGMDPARGAMPIGRAVEIRPVIGPDGPELIARTKFFDDDEFAQRLFQRYARGDMNAWSVRVCPDPRHCSAPTRSEIARRPELEDCLMVYRKGDLAEYSCVSVPGNASALTIHAG